MLSPFMLPWPLLTDSYVPSLTVASGLQAPIGLHLPHHKPLRVDIPPVIPLADEAYAGCNTGETPILSAQTQCGVQVAWDPTHV